MIGKTISHYKILNKIGEGGRGVVYKAEDTDLKRTVALKFISPHLAENTEELESLYGEARSASQLNHPNITTIYEIGHSGKHNFIAMEYVDGKTLKDKIQIETLTTDEIVKIAVATLQGIKAAHDSNIIHRDIKSENIMVSDSGVAKVMDFGLAKNLERQNVTHVSKTIGTIAYMAPEQIEGSKVDQRSDIYSFGVVLYEMITGRMPFIGEHEASTLYSIINESAPNIAEINPTADKGLIAIIEKAIEKSPKDRYQTVSEILDDINELSAGTFKSKIVNTPLSSFFPQKFSKNWLFGGVIGLLLIISVIGVLITGGKSTSINIKSLAVLNFDNILDPDDPNRLGQILQELIIADLSELPTLKVFSSQRLFDIQKQLGSDNRNAIEPGLATDIAQKAGAEIMLTGNVIQRGINTILTTQLINTNDGSIRKSHQVEGQDIYTMVDELTSRIQDELDLSTGPEQPIDVAVADKTTYSVNAFQFYFNGIDYFNESHFKEAIVEFKKAIAIDSTFSTAYYKLALAQWWSQSETDAETIENAQNSLQKVLNSSWYSTTKEKLLARGALELTKQNFDESEKTYLQLIEFMNDEKEAWYGLGEAYYHGSQNLEKSLEAFERAVELDPEFTIAYRHIFDIYGLQDDYNKGIIRATQLIEKNPDEAWAYIFLGQMLIEKKDYDQAQQAFQDALELDSDQNMIYKNLTHIYIKQKNFDEGITFAQNLLKSNKSNAQIYSLLANMYVGNNDYNQAIETTTSALQEVPDSYQLQLSLARTYQINGQYEEAKAQLDKIEKLYPEKSKSRVIYYITEVYFEQGKYKDAIQIIEGGLSRLEESNIKAKADLLNNWAYFSSLLGDFATAESKIEEVLNSSGSIKNKLISNLIKSFIMLDKNNIQEIEAISNRIFELTKDQNDAGLNKLIKDAVKLIQSYGNKEYTSVIEQFKNIDDDIDLKYRLAYYAVLAYMEIGELGKAAELIIDMRNPLLSSSDRSFAFPHSFYLEGLLNELDGNKVLAKQNYQFLLNIWKDGDEEAIDYKKVIDQLNSLNK